MKQKGMTKTVMLISVLLLIIAGINLIFNIIRIPSTSEMVSRELDFITICTVFAGFSFTTLGVILGLSSEALIEKIKNTSIIMRKVRRIVYSIIFFILSVAISLIFVLGILGGISIPEKVMFVINSGLYILGVGYMIIGICFFVYSVFELYDLLKRIYEYNKSKVDKRLDIVNEELEKARKKLNTRNDNE